MAAPLPEDDLELMALLEWLDCWRSLLAVRHPPGPKPEPGPDPWPNFLARITPTQTVVPQP